MRALLPPRPSIPLLVGLALVCACAPRADPYRAQQRSLRALASAPAQDDTAPALAGRISPDALGRVVKAAINTGEHGGFNVNTPLGATRIAVHPDPDAAPLTLTAAACDRCVQVEGVLRAGIAATLPGGGALNARAGAVLHLPMEVRAHTVPGATELSLVPRYRDRHSVDLQFQGLPLGGLGLNGPLRAGVRAAIDGQPFTLATASAAGVLPLRDLTVSPGGHVRATLRTLRGSAPPAAPDTLTDGLWFGSSAQTLTGWLEAWLLWRATPRWSARPTSVSLTDGHVDVTLEIAHHRGHPKIRQYQVAADLTVVNGDSPTDRRWHLGDLGVRRVDPHGLDLVSGPMKRRVRRQVASLFSRDLPAAGTLPLGGSHLDWWIEQLQIRDDGVQVWVGVR